MKLFKNQNLLDKQWKRVMSVAMVVINKIRRMIK